MNARLGRRGVIALVVLVLLLPASAFALLSESTGVGGNTFTTATMPVPANFSATPACNFLIGAKVTVNWTAWSGSPLTLVDGYDVYRATGSSGGTFAKIHHASPRTATQFVDTTVATQTTYRYKMVSTKATNWTSAFTNTLTVTTPGIFLGVCVF
ncbi:MAG: hypothetical protein ACRDJO_08955 [Actinomycetota bacterium]